MTISRCVENLKVKTLKWKFVLLFFFSSSFNASGLYVYLKCLVVVAVVLSCIDPFRFTEFIQPQPLASSFLSPAILLWSLTSPLLVG